jgi:hypothetical protein
LKFVVESFGSDAARVFKDGNCVVINTGLVVLFEGSVGIGNGFGTLFEDVGVGIGGGFVVTLKKFIFNYLLIS